MPHSPQNPSTAPIEAITSLGCMHGVGRNQLQTTPVVLDIIYARSPPLQHLLSSNRRRVSGVHSYQSRRRHRYYLFLLRSFLPYDSSTILHDPDRKILLRRQETSAQTSTHTLTLADSFTEKLRGINKTKFKSRRAIKT
jgi:hypothetical protein